MKYLDIDQVQYVGIDIVEELIKDNKIKYETSTKKFLCKNIVTDRLPAADLILFVTAGCI